MQNSEIYIENDKWQAPFLLAASFQGLIKFQGSQFKNGVLHWQFTPVDTAKILLQQFETKTEPHIPARDLLEAIDTFWRQISEMKNVRDGGRENGLD